MGHEVLEGLHLALFLDSGLMENRLFAIVEDILPLDLDPFAPVKHAQECDPDAGVKDCDIGDLLDETTGSIASDGAKCGLEGSA